MNIEELAQLHKALSVPVRLTILELVGERSLCVNAITRYLEISQPAVSQHLAVLKRAGLVSSAKQGYMVHYRLDRKRLQQFRQAVELFPKERLKESRSAAAAPGKRVAAVDGSREEGAPP